MPDSTVGKRDQITAADIIGNGPGMRPNDVEAGKAA
jgi:hypothetical protein